MSQQNLSEGCNQPSSVQDSHASRIRVQENVVHLVMSVTSGRKCGESYAKLNHDGFWVKTSQDSVQVKLDNSSEEYSETWPRWGIMSGGVAGRLRMLERHTTENGSSLLPTCRSREAGNYQYANGNHNKPILTLSGKIAGMLPTLNTCDATMGQLKGKEFTGNKHAMKLEQAINMLPTITCNTGKNTSPGINFDKREVKCHLDGVFMNQIGKKNGLVLQPAFAEWMMGFPEGWTALNASEMPSSRSKSTRSSKRSQKWKSKSQCRNSTIS